MKPIKKIDNSRRVIAKRRAIFPTVPNRNLHKAIKRTASRYWFEVQLYTHMAELYLDAVAIVNGRLIAIDLFGNYNYSPPRTTERNSERMKVAELNKRNIPFCRIERNSDAIEMEYEIMKFVHSLNKK